jgi:hypothetical protein
VVELDNKVALVTGSGICRAQDRSPSSTPARWLLNGSQSCITHTSGIWRPCSASVLCWAVLHYCSLPQAWCASVTTWIANDGLVSSIRVISHIRTRLAENTIIDTAITIRRASPTSDINNGKNLPALLHPLRKL